MAIDFQQVKQDQDQKLQDLIDQRQANLEGTLQKYATNVKASRDQFFKNSYQPLLAGALGKVGLTPTGSGQNFQMGNLDQTLKDSLNSERMNQTKGNIGLNFSNRSRLAGQSQQALTSANTYAQSNAEMRQKQGFDAAQAAKQRQFQLSQQDQLDRYSREGLFLQDQYQTQPDYEGALARALGSIGGLAGGYYAYSKLNSQNTPSSPSSGLNYLDPGSLTSQTQFGWRNQNPYPNMFSR